MNVHEKLVPAPVKIWVCAEGNRVTLGISKEAARAAHADKFGTLPNRTFEFEEIVWTFDS